MSWLKPREIKPPKKEIKQEETVHVFKKRQKWRVPALPRSDSTKQDLRSLVFDNRLNLSLDDIYDVLAGFAYPIGDDPNLKQSLQILRDELEYDAPEDMIVAEDIEAALAITQAQLPPPEVVLYDCNPEPLHTPLGTIWKCGDCWGILRDAAGNDHFVYGFDDVDFYEPLNQILAAAPECIPKSIRPSTTSSSQEKDASFYGESFEAFEDNLAASPDILASLGGQISPSDLLTFLECVRRKDTELPLESITTFLSKIITAVSVGVDLDEFLEIINSSNPYSQLLLSLPPELSDILVVARAFSAYLYEHMNSHQRIDAACLFYRSVSSCLIFKLAQHLENNTLTFKKLRRVVFTPKPNYALMFKRFQKTVVDAVVPEFASVTLDRCKSDVDRVLTAFEDLKSGQRFQSCLRGDGVAHSDRKGGVRSLRKRAPRPCNLKRPSGMKTLKIDWITFLLLELVVHSFAPFDLAGFLYWGLGIAEGFLNMLINALRNLSIFGWRPLSWLPFVNFFEVFVFKVLYYKFKALSNIIREPRRGYGTWHWGGPLSFMAIFLPTNRQSNPRKFRVYVDKILRARGYRKFVYLTAALTVGLKYVCRFRNKYSYGDCIRRLRNAIAQWNKNIVGGNFKTNCVGFARSAKNYVSDSKAMKKLITRGEL